MMNILLLWVSTLLEGNPFFPLNFIWFTLINGTLKLAGPNFSNMNQIKHTVAVLQ